MQYCFDQTISSIGAAGVAFVAGYDSASFSNAAKVNEAIDPTNQNCMVATYPAAGGIFPDIQAATVAGVGNDTVRDVASRQNPRGSVPLTGSTQTPTAGQTEGPDLVSASLDQATSQVTFTFDEAIRNTAPAPAPADFGFYTDSTNGNAGIVGTSIVSTGSKTVIVQFPGSVLSAKGFFVKGALGGGTGTPRDASLGAAPHNASVGYSGPPLSAAVSVVSAAKESGNQVVDVTFDQAITVAGSTPANIVAYRVDGTTVAATSISTVNTNTSAITVTFPSSIADDPASITRIGFAPGAIASSDGTGSNQYAAAAIGQDNTKPGFTDGPDLQSTTIDDNTNKATFIFDEETQRNAALNGTNFVLVNKDGSTTAGNAAGVVQSTDLKSITVQFPSSGSAAAGVALDQGAVNDNATGDLNGNLTGNVAVGVLNDQPGTASPTPTVVVPTATAVLPTPTAVVPTPTPTVTPVKTRKVSSKVSSLKKKGKKVTGKVKAASPCKSGRKVVLKKGSKTIASAKSKGSGKFTLKSKKAKGKLKVSVRSRTITSGGTKVSCKSVTKKV